MIRSTIMLWPSASPAPPPRSRPEKSASSIWWHHRQQRCGKAADKLLQDRFGKERTSLEKQGESLKKDMDQFRKQAAAMSEDARNKKGRDLQTRIQEFEKKQNDLNQRIAPVQGAVDKQLLEVLSEACSTYAKATAMISFSTTILQSRLSPVKASM